MYPKMVYLNGKITEAENARISVFDRGFIFGDGVYEVIARINGRLFYKDAHLNRLRWCLEQIRIDVDVSALESDIPALLEASGLANEDCLIYFQVTRGVAPRQHSFPEEIQPTIMMYAWPKKLPDIDNRDASVITREDYRWSRCDIKSTSLLGNILANEEAMRNEAYETVFIRDGVITEASHCNVFFVKDGIVYTHPRGPFILDGITRQVVLELCQKLNIECREEAVRQANLKNMDEAFLTGTGSQIMAIKKFDDHTFYEQEKGPLTRTLQEAFLELKSRKVE